MNSPRPIIAYPGSSAKGRLGWLWAVAVLPAMLVATPVASDPAGVVDGDFPEMRFKARVLAIDNTRVEGLDVSLRADGTFAAVAESVVAQSGRHRLGAIEVDGVLDDFGLLGDGIEANGLLRYEGIETDWNLANGEETLSGCAVTLAQPLSRLAGRPGVPSQAGWLKSGELGVCIRYGETSGALTQLSVDTTLTDLSFDSPDGLYAGEALAAEIFLTSSTSDMGNMSVTGTVSGGAILLSNFYADFTAAAVAVSYTHLRAHET